MIERTQEESQNMDSDFVLLHGVDRLLIQNTILYYKTQEKLGLTKLIPLERELIEEVEFLLENNQPIEKQKLYELNPNLFDLEISDLPLIEQERLRRRVLKIVPVR